MNRARIQRSTAGQQLWLPMLCLAISAAVFFTGCGGVGTTMTQTDSNLPPTPAAFAGVMQSGSNPVSGAAISFYAAGSSGPGMGATNLLGSQTVTTDASGKFSIPDFQCPGSGTQVYLVGRGGSANPAAGHNNALVMMAALGDCGSVGSSTTVAMNEVTTAAAAWALAQFIGTDAVIGTSATNATGLGNAFLTAANLADTSKGTAPGPGLPRTQSWKRPSSTHWPPQCGPATSQSAARRARNCSAPRQWRMLRLSIRWTRHSVSSAIPEPTRLQYLRPPWPVRSRRLSVLRPTTGRSRLPLETASQGAEG